MEVINNNNDNNNFLNMKLQKFHNMKNVTFFKKIKIHENNITH